jgi:methionine-rich copper-binding protein CopC
MELKSMRVSHCAVIFAGVVSLASGAIAAPPALVDSTPAADGIATKPAAAELTFDQPVAAATATYEVLMLTMPGMKMDQPMRMAVVSSTLDPSGKVLTATFKAPLPGGTYGLNWTVKNATGETGSGVVNFGVR